MQYFQIESNISKTIQSSQTIGKCKMDIEPATSNVLCMSLGKNVAL
jgi:hypothetical protein